MFVERLAKSITEFSGEYEELLKQVRDQQDEVDKWIDALEVEINSRTEEKVDILSGKMQDQQITLMLGLDELRRPIARVAQHISDMHDNIQQTERQAILQNLSLQPYFKHHGLVTEKVLKDTGRWLLLDSQYIAWQQSSASSILWLHGIPGSGKSCLVYVGEFSHRYRHMGVLTTSSLKFYCD